MIPIGKKLLIGKVLMIVLLLIIVITSITIIDNLSKTGRKMEVEYVEVNSVQELRISFQQIILSVQNFIIQGQSYDINNFEHSLNNVKKQIKKSEVTITNNHNKKHLISFEKDVLMVESLARKLFDIETNKDKVATKILLEQINSISILAVNEINMILLESKLEMNNYIDINKKTNVSGKKFILIFGIFTAGFLIVGGYFFLKSIMKPINQLIRSTQRISTGNLVTNDVVRAKDEIGDLITSFNSMISILDRTTVSREYFNNVLSRMDDSLIITDADSKIAVVNKTTLDLLGYKEEEIIGKHYEVIFGKDLDKVAFSKNTIVKDLGNEVGFHNIFNTYYSKEGHKIPVLFSASSMLKEKGQSTGMIFIANYHHEENIPKEIDTQIEPDEYAKLHNVKMLGGIPLTKREIEIMKLIAEEYSNQEIAEMLFISVRTVETHRKNIMQKLHVKSVIALVKYAALNGII